MRAWVGREVGRVRSDRRDARVPVVVDCVGAPTPWPFNLGPDGLAARLACPATVAFANGAGCVISAPAPVRLATGRSSRHAAAATKSPTSKRQMDNLTPRTPRAAPHSRRSS
jgi:hypothetical protein